MTRIVRGLAVSVAALAILLPGAPRAAEASLIGDSVTCTYSSPLLQLKTCLSPTAIVGAGVEFEVGNIFEGNPSSDFTVDLAASSITLTTTTLGGHGFGSAGLHAVFGDLDSSLGDIVDVSVSVNGAFGIDASDVGFTADSVTINLDNSLWTVGDNVVISLIFENAATVPVPTTLFLLGSVVTGLGAVRAWRRR
jgi:hypothetical protein